MSTTHSTQPDLLDSLVDPKPTRTEAAMILDHFITAVPGQSPAGEGYDQARRVLSAAVQHDLDPDIFADAAAEAGKLTDVRNGADLEHLFGPGRRHSRDVWGQYLEINVSLFIDQMVSGIPE